MDYVLTQMICNRYFFKEHGYEIHDNIVYQDNHSTIELEHNGKQLSSKQTIHNNIRYYFITDIITNQEQFVEFLPTLGIIGDFFASLLQVSQFRFIRNTILGIHEHDIPFYNACRRTFLEEKKLKLENKKEETKKAYKISGNMLARFD